MSNTWHAPRHDWLQCYFRSANFANMCRFAQARSGHHHPVVRLLLLNCSWSQIGQMMCLWQRHGATHQQAEQCTIESRHYLTLAETAWAHKTFMWHDKHIITSHKIPNHYMWLGCLSQSLAVSWPGSIPCSDCCIALRVFHKHITLPIWLEPILIVDSSICPCIHPSYNLGSKSRVLARAPSATIWVPLATSGQAYVLLICDTVVYGFWSHAYCWWHT